MIETTWFILLSGMLATFVALAGADLGVGIVHFLVGRTQAERWQVIRTIRPVWKPNEVWLVASGGTLFLAFPTALATAFSGFYLPLMLVLWLLVFRGLGVELRYQIPDPMWAQAWDFALSAASLLLTVCLGAALGNVVRGVPLNAEGTFFEPLWTDFRVGENTGVLDWYTVLVGIAAVLALAHHGSLWLSAYTDGEVQQRAQRLAGRLWGAVLLALIVVTACSFAVQPAVSESLRARPWGIIFPLTGLSGLVGARLFRQRGNQRASYLASCLALYGMCATVAVSIFPNILPARDPAHALTVFAAAAPANSLKIGLIWWIPGILLVIGYFIYIHSMMPRTFSIHQDIDD